LPVALDAQGHRPPYVFTRHGQPIKSIREIFARVCKEVGGAKFVFHDLRHTATTNLRRAGVDALTAMEITGHKMMVAFRRYNTIDENDRLVARRQMDTYLDTKAIPVHEEHV
jgi:integrase